MGKFIAVMPPAVIAMLTISLIESLIILPCHLAHSKSKRRGWHYRLRVRVEGGVDWIIKQIYQPSLRWALHNPWAVFSLATGSLLLVAGLVQGGFTPFELMPEIDGNVIRCRYAFPDGTPAHVTEKASRRIEEAVWKLAHELSPHDDPDHPLLKMVYRSIGSRAANGPMEGAKSGSNVGEIWVELMPIEQREVLMQRHGLGDRLGSKEILTQWREAVGDLPGMEDLTFRQAEIAPGDKDIEFKLVGHDIQKLNEAADEAKEQLRRYPGVYDISDDSREGKWELQLKVRPEAEALGVRLADLAATVRATYYGEEVMRLQRGRHEVKLMVRYPPEERKSLSNFNEIRHRTPQGAEIPLPELAQVDRQRAWSEINRLNQQRSVTVTAEVDSKRANANQVVTDLKAKFMPDMLARYRKSGVPIAVRFEGQRQQQEESIASLRIGFMVALLVMFVLLTMEFRSYAQPLIILAIIPFGLVGAVLGHLVMGLSVSMFSLFGLVALSGVVANDAIVLIDFINHRRGEGAPLIAALLDAGIERFRPVMLTSITTVAGLMPILLERSMQAQVLIPMAVSLSFGLMAATLWVLWLVPTMYLAYARAFKAWPSESPDEPPQTPIPTRVALPTAAGPVVADS